MNNTTLIEQRLEEIHSRMRGFQDPKTREEVNWLIGYVEALQADLAVARAVLEFVVPVMEGYPKNTIGEALYSMAIDQATGALSHLGIRGGARPMAVEPRLEEIESRNRRARDEAGHVWNCSCKECRRRGARPSRLGPGEAFAQARGAVPCVAGEQPRVEGGAGPMTVEQRLAEIDALLGYGPMAPDRAPQQYLALHRAAEYLRSLVCSQRAVVEAAAKVIQSARGDIDDDNVERVDLPEMEHLWAALQSLKEREERDR